MYSWHVADHGITSDSVGVTRWADQSGHGHDLTARFGGVTLARGAASGHDAVTFQSGALREACDPNCAVWPSGTLPVIWLILRFEGIASAGRVDPAWRLGVSGMGPSVGFRTHVFEGLPYFDWYADDPPGTAGGPDGFADLHFFEAQLSATTVGITPYHDFRGSPQPGTDAVGGSLTPSAPQGIGPFIGSVAETLVIAAPPTGIAQWEEDCVNQYLAARYAIPLP